MGWKELFQIFQIDFVISPSTVILGILWVIAVFIGYYIMSSQVKLVKKETWTYKDTLKCMIFAFYFGTGIIIGITMLETLYFQSYIEPEKTFHDNQAPYILFPVFFCLIFITIYPLLDFLFMAASKNELSVVPIQKPFEKVIKLFKKPYSYFAAIGLYILIYPVPLYILTVYFNVEWIIAWISLALLYPMVMISYYASIGYVIGFWVLFSRIPAMKKSTFLAYDKNNRGFKEFMRDPMTRIVWATLVFTYFNLPYIVYYTLSRLSPNFDIEGSGFRWNLYLLLSLISAISTFFSRYWQRKVKVNTRSILFSAFLIAAVGVNLLVNYTIARPYMFDEIWNTWDLSNVLYDFSNSGIYNFQKLNVIGVTEELTIMLVINYYFLVEKDRKLVFDSIKGSVTASCEKFNPTPGFNMVRYKKKEHREFAKGKLIQMYERIPYKQSSFSEITIKDPLMDAICDSSNTHAQKAGSEIFLSLVRKFPENTTNLVKEGLNSSNFEKTYQITEVLLKSEGVINRVISENLIYEIIEHPEERIRANLVKLLTNIYHQKHDPKEKIELPPEKLNKLTCLLKTSNFLVELEVLKLLKMFHYQIDPQIFISRLNSSNIEIQSYAAKSIALFDQSDVKNLPFDKIREYLNHSNPKFIASALSSLAIMGNFDKNKISIDTFMKRLEHQNSEVQLAAINGVIKFLKEKPRSVPPLEFLNLLKKNKESNIALLTGILRILSEIWNIYPNDVLPIFIEYLKSKNHEISKISQNTIIKMAQKNPKKIVRTLIQEQDTESFIKRGKITETLYQIANSYHKKTISLLLSRISSDNLIIRKNTAVVIKGLVDKYPDDISIEKVLKSWDEEKISKIKRELTQIIILYVNHYPNSIRPYIDLVFQQFDSADENGKKNIAKIFEVIGEKEPTLLSYDKVEILLSNEISRVREVAMRILAEIGNGQSEKTMMLVKRGLDDKDWTVRNATIDVISSLGLTSASQEMINEIKKLLRDQNKWTRKAILEFYEASFREKKPIFSYEEFVPYIQNFENEPDNLKIGLKILVEYSNEKFKDIFNILIHFMRDPIEKNRKSGINAMIQLSNKISIEKLLPKLLYYLTEETEILLQESIAISLGRIVKYEKAEIKNRAIALLRLRSNVSQNKILTDVLSKLEN